MYPQAADATEFWRNIVSGADAITEFPADRIPARFYDPQSTDLSTTYANRGGFLGKPVAFDPRDYGMMPVIVEAGEPEQFLALKAAHQALLDAGYDLDQMDGLQTEVVVGKGNYPNRGIAIANQHINEVPDIVDVWTSLRPGSAVEDVRRAIKQQLTKFGQDNAASLVPNFTSARVANRFNLMGMNFTVDAACASSLVALEIGTRDLLTGKCDVAMVGGVFLLSDLVPIVLFSQLRALSRQGQIRPFDAAADGTLMGEGVGMLVIKRLDDAQADNDRIYAVVKGVGSASDGRALALLAPRVEGQVLALQRAFEMANVSPDTLGLIEAHGTATLAGDDAEMQTLRRVFGERSLDRMPHIALGTVKSMIGHAMPAAGAAGLIKAVLSLYHKVLPPTLHADHPNPKLKFDDSPFYLNSRARPWIHGGGRHPRRAGVNAFGFGGANAHAVLEEYRDPLEDERPTLLTEFPTELCIVDAPDREGLVVRLHQLGAWLDANQTVNLRDVAYTLHGEAKLGGARIAFVAESLADLTRKVQRAEQRLGDPTCLQIKDARGTFYFSAPLATQGKLAFVFPGEGAQYAGMLADLCMHFPVVRRAFDHADDSGSLDYVYPPPWPEWEQRAQQRLWTSIGGAVKAVLTADLAMLALTQQIGLTPEAVLGHSSGDFIAMLAGGMATYDNNTAAGMFDLWEQYDSPQESQDRVGLLAVGGDASNILQRLGDLAASVTVAMDNCPHQAVIAGPAETIERAQTLLVAGGIICERLPFDRPYHTAGFAGQSGPLRTFLEHAQLEPARTPVYSCTSAAMYPTDVAEARQLAIEHWHTPVQFQQTIRRMYADGIRLFVEVGPRLNLTSFIDDILRGQQYLAVSMDSPRKHGVTHLQFALGLLAAHGVNLRLDPLFTRRMPQLVSFVTPAGRPADPVPTVPLAVAQLHPLVITLPVEGTPGVSPEPEPKASDPVGVEVTVQPHEHAGSDGAERSTYDDRAPLADDANVVSASVTPAPALGNAEARLTPPLLVPSALASLPDAQSEAAMTGYLQVMEEFLAVQQAVMESFFAPQSAAMPSSPPEVDVSPPDSEPASPLGPEVPLAGVSPVAAQPQDYAAGEHAEYPLLGSIRSYLAGKALRAERTLSVDADAFLKDHTLGRTVSADPRLLPLAVVPMTVSLEIMAEAAQALFPRLCVTGMEHVRSMRWIVVRELPTTIHIVAEQVRQVENQQWVRVSLWDGDPGREPNATPAAQGMVRLEPAYPTPPTLEPLELAGARPYGSTVADIYRYLFHGPRFRAISALHTIGDDGLIGELKALDLSGLRGIGTQQPFVLDPVLFDAAGQLLGAWAYEQIAKTAVIFPIGIDMVTLFGPRLDLPATLLAQVRMLEFGHRQVRATVELADASSRVFARLEGWRDFRFHVPEHRFRMFHAPQDELSGELWPVATAGLPARGGYVAVLVEGVAEKDNDTLSDVVGNLVLSQAERSYWQGMPGAAMRKAEWLIGRIAIKDAARTFVFERSGSRAYPADVEVVPDANGRPTVGGLALAGMVAPVVTLSHKGLVAVAVAGDAEQSPYLGIDIEPVRSRPEGFTSLAFSVGEHALLDTIDVSDRDEWMTRLWCAKEAVAKATGLSHRAGPADVEIRFIDQAMGTVHAVLAGELAHQVPGLGTAPLIVHTARAHGFIVATTAAERVGEHA